VKKIVLFLFCAMFTAAFASNPPKSNAMNMDNMDMSTMNSSKSNMMYMDFGLGIGTVANWEGQSLAINAMTMGFYYKPNLGVEIGMDMLPNGSYENNGAMINSFHLDAKAIWPVSKAFNLYGKLGLGVNAGQGTSSSSMTMDGMDMMEDMKMITTVNVGPYYGAGVQFNLSPKFALYLEDSGVIAIGNSNGNSFGSTNLVTAGLEIRM
jgi:hypothetical protein